MCVYWEVVCEEQILEMFVWVLTFIVLLNATTAAMHLRKHVHRSQCIRL